MPGGNKAKSTSVGLGRALIRQHNQHIQQVKERGVAFRQEERRLQSVTDVSDIDAVLQNAEETGRNFAAADPPSNLINLDAGAGENVLTAEEKRAVQMEEEEMYASMLKVPRRPPWNARMPVEQLDKNEREAFLVWRRNLARLEENENLILTPFEKNLDIWRQLWRVLERSDLLVMVVDARDPLFYRCPDLEAYALEIDEHKRTMLLINKADLLPYHVRQLWAKYFNDHGILFVFWSAKAASAALEGKKLSTLWEGEQQVDEADTKIYGRDELLSRLQTEAEAIVATRRALSEEESQGAGYTDSGTAHTASKHAVVGFVGYPNVGKSSTINALVGEKRTGVTSTPGKTKHFQTLIISEELMLCDCPGLVFPSFSSSRHEMVASGVLPINRLTEQREAVEVVAARVPRDQLERIYNIKLPKPKPYEPQSRPPTAAELFRAYCSSRGHVSTSGLPDETRAARQILNDYLDGKLPHFELPPGELEDAAEVNMVGALGGSSSLEVEVSDTCDSDDQVHPHSAAGGPLIGIENLENALDDLESFDLGGGLLSKTAAATKKKDTAPSHKHHRKPQRKKDRTWRVGNDNGDGMPVVRVVQKPAVNFESIKASNLKA